MTRDQMKHAGVYAIGLLVVFFCIGQCQNSRWSAKVAQEQARTRRVIASARVDSALAAAAIARADAYRIERDSAQNAARRANAEADRLRADRRRITPVASQPGTAPTVSDVLVAKEAALENCEQETVALRQTIAADSAAVRAGMRREAELAGALALKSRTVDSLTGVVNRQAPLIDRAAKPDRCLFWNCPSRTHVALGTAVVVTVLHIALTR